MGMVPYVAFNEGNARFADPVIKAAFQALPNLVIDGLLEDPNEANAAGIAKWLADAKAVITSIRNLGYKHPISIHAMEQGRQLKAVLDHGAELVAHDPMHNIITGCQMYWPLRADGGFEWNADQGFGRGAAGIAEAFRQIALAPFPIQLGFATGDENQRPNPLDQQLTLAAANNVPFLHWDLWESNIMDALYANEAMTVLTAAGQLMIKDHPGGFKTAVKATGF